LHTQANKPQAAAVSPPSSPPQSKFAVKGFVQREFVQPGKSLREKVRLVNVVALQTEEKMLSSLVLVKTVVELVFKWTQSDVKHVEFRLDASSILVQTSEA
jgi:hypothetical protein